MNSNEANRYAAIIAEERGYIPRVHVNSFLAGAQKYLLSVEPNFRPIHTASYLRGMKAAEIVNGLEPEARRAIFERLDLALSE